MHMMRLLARPLGPIVMACMLIGAMATPAAQAGMVGTQAAVADGGPGAHAELGAILARADVRAQLEALGVDPQRVEQRVAALSDAEAQALAQRLEELPAGGADVLGVLLVVFLVLLFTDIMGFTDVFPFVKKTAR